MNFSHTFAGGFRVLTCAGLLLALSPGCKRAPMPAAKPPAPVTKPVVAIATATVSTDAFKSAFEDLLPPKGRDPFFPDSHRREPAPAPIVVAAARKAAVASDLLLKGIVGSANHRLAVVNNQILEKGETAPVRVAGGVVKVKCLEIGDSFALVMVEGETRMQRLEMDKK
ncbi:MAG TPA: hypothetical protein VGO67_04650 [Verrucomicrobiae bacterium]|jgi:hypothetical protein